MLKTQYKSMGLGINFGEMAKENYHGSLIPTYLGDPTLTMRNKPQTHPTANLSNEDFDLGNVNVGVLNTIEINIKNSGSTNLEFPRTYHFLSHDNRRSSYSPIIFFPLAILPGQTRKVTINFNPPEPGVYKGFLIIQTNDPDNVFLHINYQAEAE